MKRNPLCPILAKRTYMNAYFENPQQLVEAYQPSTFNILFSTYINITVCKSGYSIFQQCNAIN